MEDSYKTIEQEILTADRELLEGRLESLLEKANKGSIDKVILQKVVSENLTKIMEKTMPKDVDKILKAVSMIIDVVPFVETNFEEVVQKADRMIIPDLIEVFLILGLENEVINHFDELLQATEDASLYKLITVMKMVPNAKPLLEQSVTSIIERTKGYGMVLVIRELKENEVCQQKIIDNASKVIQNTSDFQIPNLLSEMQSFMSPEEISNHMEEWIACCRSASFVQLLQELNKDPYTKEKLKDYQPQVEQKIIECCTRYSKEELEKEEIYNFIQIILKEVQENEKVALSDIKRIGNGKYSVAYQLGEKVLKFGHRQKVKRIPSHKRILQPLLRRSVYNKERTRQLFLWNISEKVYNSKEIPITEDDAYVVYKDFRDDGIVWTDVNPRNIGKLKKPNRVYMEGLDQVDDASVRIDTRERAKRSTASRRMGGF